MDAVKYFEEKRRMCKTLKDCKKCPLQHIIDWHCKDIQQNFPEQAVEVVEKWSKENPQKTMMSDFFEKHPNAKKDGKGEPKICPFVLGYTKDHHCYGKNCFDCWNRPLEG